jgi:diguanylate cyclase (GGDEF)-like protein
VEERRNPNYSEASLAASSSSTVTTPLIAIVAALALCVGVLGALLVAASRRAGRRADARVSEAVETLNQRMDDLGRELAGAVERAEEEGRRNRVLGDIATSIDLDEVLARTLEAALALPGADAALTTLESHDGKPIVATLGLSAEEAERQTIAGPPDGRQARSIAFAYRYAADEDADGLIHGGLAVPVGAEPTGEIGYLAVFSRTPRHVFGDEVADRLEELASRAGPAIDNARRFREARQLADLDALTGLHNRRYFHETLARECARAHRYTRELALIVLDLDDFKEVNDRIGHLAGDAVLAELAERVRDVVRSADIACRVGGDEFAVILPESSLEDAEQLYRRINDAVSSRSLGQGGMLHLSAGVAGLRREDDAISFFKRADDALYRAKEQGKGRAVAANAH